MRPKTLVALVSLAFMAFPSWAEEAMPVVAVDAHFAPVAQILTTAFAERTGQGLKVLVREAGEPVPSAVAILLASDTDLPARLASEGVALPETIVTYAMGQTGTDAALLPRDAVLMASAAENAVARDFMGFLVTSDAWDLVVTHGFGAY